MKLKQLKSELKDLAVEIRSLKSTRKSVPNGYVHGLARAQYIFRHKHIAYCILRGKSYEQVELKVREGNEPNKKLVIDYVEQYKEVVNETVCAG